MSDNAEIVRHIYEYSKLSDEDVLDAVQSSSSIERRAARAVLARRLAKRSDVHHVARTHHEPNCSKVRARSYAECDCNPDNCTYCGNPLSKHPMTWTGISGRSYFCSSGRVKDIGEQWPVDSADHAPIGG